MTAASGAASGDSAIATDPLDGYDGSMQITLEFAG